MNQRIADRLDGRTEARRCALVAIGALLLAGCSPTPHRAPPPTRSFEGLPISGTLANARAAGFTNCVGDPVSMRCRRAGVTLEGHGPYDAAVDLVGGDGSGGFDQLMLWDERDQFAVQAVGDALENDGWHVCRTGQEGAETRRSTPAPARRSESRSTSATGARGGSGSFRSDRRGNRPAEDRPTAAGRHDCPQSDAYFLASIGAPRISSSTARPMG
jgi:hypothetical protein